MTQHKSEHKMTFADKMSDFISNNRIIIWAILALIVVLTIVFAVVDSKLKEKNDLYSDMTVEIQEDYQNWFTASEEEKDSKETIFLEKISSLTESDKTNILIEKALFLRGQFYLQKENWESAYSDFMRIATDSPDSYLASVSLYNAATSKENSGDLQAALETLIGISDNYRSNSPIIPETLFNMGRLHESLGNNEEAIIVYEDLSTTYSSSNWTNLAKTRIISLKASGVSQ